ncbi:hypothetical protein [Nostoc sp. TCL26-01]|uniref:hypothetical protein n=1 Tax=Nostoc sp. TCL26-01 TaxID=2576904 RepID=UPI0015C061B3|nr:hypothetical protein [Nostoc sp. TCL26-01]QLE59929.1 hypothetical protein FD725_31450 [Nostoc sp. TCL26-01]
MLANSGLDALIAGKDPGAGYGKAVYGDFSIMMPAAYSVVRNRNIRHHETIVSQFEIVPNSSMPSDKSY